MTFAIWLIIINLTGGVETMSFRTVEACETARTAVESLHAVVRATCVGAINPINKKGE